MKLLYQLFFLATMCYMVESSSATNRQQIKRSINQYFELQNLYRHFMKIYNKTYSKEEYEKRFFIFAENLKRAATFQSKNRGTARFGITKFSDLTAEEFRKIYLGLKPELGVNITLPKAEIPNIGIPQQFDWREENKISEVKNQGQCGSCWAFSTTGNIEALYAIQKGQSLTLSEQELLDCDTLDDGCDGGYVTRAYKAIQSIGGLESEEAYPYEGDKETCRVDSQDIVARISGGVSVSSDEGEMARWLYQNGPISVALNAVTMQAYKGGIDHPGVDECNPKDLNHAVLIVGYGVEDDTPYWIIKNSWGTSWGEDGYYRVFRGDGTCGLNKAASSAVL